MVSDKGETRRTFNDAAQHNNRKKRQEIDVPEMIRKDQPVPRPKPPAIGGVVDAQSFDRRWNHETKKSAPLDPFDAIDEQHKKSLSQEFEQASKSTGQRGQERD